MLALQQLAHVDIRHPANAQSVGKAIRDFTAGEAGLMAVRAAACSLYDNALNGKSLLIDKTPRYYLILDYIQQVFPKAKYLWLIRNPFDIAASYKTTWGVDLPEIITKRLDDSLFFDFITGIDNLERFATVMGDTVHRVRYETLVNDPAGTMAGVLDFLGCSTAEAQEVTDLSRQKRAADSFGDPKILGTTAPHTQSIGSWEKLFTPAELQVLFDALGRERLERLGYGDTVERLLALGVEDRGQETADALVAHTDALLATRYSDIERVTSLGITLSDHIQERARYVVAGDEAWDQRYTDRAVLDQTLAFIEQERAENARQHALQAAEIDNRGRHIADLDERIARLMAEQERLAQERDALLREIDYQKQAATHREEALATVEEACNKLRSALKERDDQIAGLLNSTSWKLTAPLRAISGAGKPK